MQEPAKRTTTELGVVMGVENELMPKIVDALRRHRDVLLAASQVRQEELTERVTNELAVFER
jgi:hypothetical protein